MFLIAVGAALIAVLWYGFERTNIGAKIRAAVDNRRMAQSVGINVDRLFTLTFAVGSGLAALGGGLAIQLFGLTPSFAVIYLVFFLLVVAVGGSAASRARCRRARARHLRHRRQIPVCRCRRLLHLRRRRADPADQACGTLWPRVARIAARRRRDRGERARAVDFLDAPPSLSRRRGAAVAARDRCLFHFPRRMTFGSQVLIMMLFALSLDLILGYAGIVTLGHAAFFGIGAYTAALLITALRLERADLRPRLRRAIAGGGRRLRLRLVPAALSRPDAADADALHHHHAAGARQPVSRFHRRL